MNVEKMDYAVLGVLLVLLKVAHTHWQNQTLKKLPIHPSRGRPASTTPRDRMLAIAFCVCAALLLIGTWST